MSQSCPLTCTCRPCHALPLPLSWKHVYHMLRSYANHKVKRKWGWGACFRWCAWPLTTYPWTHPKLHWESELTDCKSVFSILVFENVSDLSLKKNFRQLKYLHFSGAVAAHTFNLSTWEVETWTRLSSKIARAMQRNPVFKQTKTNIPCKKYISG